MYPAGTLLTVSCEKGGLPGLVEMSDVSTHSTEVLVSHANARLTVHGRQLLVDRVLLGGRRTAHVAAN